MIAGKVIAPFSERLSKPSALHGAEARAQTILGLGAWGKGVKRLGALNTPSPFPQYKRLYPPYSPEMLGNT